MYQISRLPSIMRTDETLVVLREDTDVGLSTTYVDGKPTKGAPMQFPVRANVQPMSGQELLLLPEGDRSREQLLVWVVPTVEGVRLNDKVQRQGRAYQVQNVEDWGCYLKARISAIDVADQTPLAVP